MVFRRRKNISILGSYSASSKEQELAFKLGTALADMNLNVISGGQQGVMYHLSKAIFENRSGGKGSSYIVGILPKTGFDEGNEFLDLAIPSGATHLQNSLVALSGDFVVAIGGSAGTLTEISFAWQFKKPIALLGEDGWAGKLANTRLDDRREGIIPHFNSVELLMDWISLTSGKL